MTSNDFSPVRSDPLLATTSASQFPYSPFGYTRLVPLCLLALLCLTRAVSEAQTAPVPSAHSSEEPVILNKVQVTATTEGETVPLSVAIATTAEIPGTASVVDLADVRRGRAANAEDMLSFQPGVFAQATSGNSANKISIRGSGLNTFYQGYSLGTKYLYDGQPITGPGGTQEELLAVASPNYIEILNGPNAFTYASTSLGGAINFVTQNGRTAPGLRSRFEAGSFGYRRGEISYGGATGRTDYFLSYAHNERDGFQINTPNKGDALVINVGQRFTDRLESRLIIRYQREELRNGSTLTKPDIAADPSRNRTIGLATATTAAQSARRKPRTTVVSSTTSYAIDQRSKIELGLSNTNYPLNNGWLYSNTPQDWRSDDVNVTLRYQRQDEFFGFAHRLNAVLSDTVLVDGDVHGYFDRRDGTPRVLTQYTKYSGSRDTVYALSDEVELLKNTFWLTAGLSYAEIDRDVRIQFSTLNTPNPLGFPRAVRYIDRNVLPRFGARYRIAGDVQIFGSVSKAVDGPVTWQIGSTGSSYARPLRPQEATTVEAGVRGAWKIFEGSFTVYRAKLDNELLTIRISDDPTVLPVNANASPTVHQGIEAALSTTLWRTGEGDRISLRQSFALNDFYFENDPTWGHKELPSLPREAYQAELLYQHRKGFYASVNLRAASRYFVDFANTVEADPYAIVGLKVGYNTDRWQVFVDLRNLTDEHYATAANTIFNAAGNLATAQNFYPGDKFNVIAGASLRF